MGSNRILTSHFIFCYFITIWCLIPGESKALATGAAYQVKNKGTNQCLTAGPLQKPRDQDSKLQLFKEGTMFTKNCSSTSNTATTDFGQEWTVRIKKANPGNKLYQIQLVMLNTQYEDPAFHARLRGEFISYFPKLISLKQEANKNLDDEFIIVNPDTGFCLTDEINSKQVEFSECVKLDGKRGTDNGGAEKKFQLWNFTLVNEIPIAKDRGN